MDDYVLAQVNIGRLLAPIESPLIADFVAALDEVNATADAAPGFVWRLQTEDGDATAVRGFERDAVGSGGGVIINMSVWESVEALAAYAYGAGHVEVLRRGGPVGEPAVAPLLPVAARFRFDPYRPAFVVAAGPLPAGVFVDGDSR